MDTHSLLSHAASLVEPFARSVTVVEPDRLDATLASGHLLDAVAALRHARWGYLAAITGLDVPSDARVEVLYHFCHAAAVVTLHVTVPYDAATVPSLSAVIPSARLYEIEVSEMFGVTVQGLPSTHLLLPDDWPAGVYPLRKSFAGSRPDAPVNAS